MVNPRQELKELLKTKEFFIGIDSDGCVFDTMEVKHKECFCPNFIKYFDLQNISKYARETWEFVNLYSKSRGTNRFLALIITLEMLGKRKEVIARNTSMPDMSVLIEWTQKETKLANHTLANYHEKRKNKILSNTYHWSLQVNKDIEDMVHGIRPFPLVKDTLNKIKENADIIVVSQTPVEALTREWTENKMMEHVKLIAGQEHGRKSEHLDLAAKRKYPDDKILMIGDAPGDLQAAKTNNVLFYPINPGNEEESWERLNQEALDEFFKGRYKGQYQEKLIKEFDDYLPEYPLWR